MVNSLVFLTLCRQRQSLTVNYRNHRKHLLRSRLLNVPACNVPSGTLQNKAVDEGTIFGSGVNLFYSLFGDISLNIEFVELYSGSPSLLVSSGSHDLLDGSEVGLRIEEP